MTENEQHCVLEEKLAVGDDDDDEEDEQNECTYPR